MDNDFVCEILDEEYKKNHISESQKEKALEYLASLSGNGNIPGNITSLETAVALVFFCTYESENFRTFKQLGDYFGLEPKEFALKVREIGLLLELPYFNEVIKSGLIKTETKIPNSSPLSNFKDSFKITTKSGATINELNDVVLIDLFKKFKYFIDFLFKDKEYIEIGQYIKLFELNLFMAGYDINDTNIQKKFSDLFVFLDFKPQKGNSEPEKVVPLKNRSGKYESFSRIKIGDYSE